MPKKLQNLRTAKATLNFAHMYCDVIANSLPKLGVLQVAALAWQENITPRDLMSSTSRA